MCSMPSGKAEAIEDRAIVQVDTRAENSFITVIDWSQPVGSKGSLSITASIGLALFSFNSQMQCWCGGAS